MTVKLSNNVESSLRDSINAVTTTITVASGHGARFPTLGVSEHFYATLTDAAGLLEIVKVTARSGDSLTVIRGSEGTTARNFPAGSLIEMRVTAASVLDAATDAAVAAAGAVTLASLGVTSTAAEVNYTDGVTSPIQTQLNGKQATITGGASTVTTANLTASRALISDATGKIAVSATVSDTELGYLDGVTSSIQTQLNGKQPLDADLTALAGLSTTGIVARVGVSNFIVRTIVGGANVSVTNGDGVAGNPTISVTGGASGGGSDAIFWQNDQTVTTNYTILSGKNAMSAGPITIGTGVTVTIPSGSVWTIV